ncbi:Cts2p [Sugiyamaella lignohabitans]|uniref:chitinase n=1 Tax=Sugiyamaella lignohabitans TaxID=796027 RepID=A0A167FVK7_9ASCO|nr:Cts2p [Sugiyamaella lignohabitans]ANB15754.1 Cts2p [Sugiyamaella lignohabitans]
MGWFHHSHHGSQEQQGANPPPPGQFTYQTPEQAQAQAHGIQVPSQFSEQQQFNPNLRYQNAYGQTPGVASGQASNYEGSSDPPPTLPSPFRQSSYNSTNSSSPLPSIPNSPQQRKFKTVLYFCNWAIYGRKHFPSDIPVDRLTHILYAFSNVNATTGEVILSDKWADTDCSATRFRETNGGGCFGEFYRIKMKNRNLRILLSIGGWTYSNDLGLGVNTHEKRQNFVKTAVTLLRDLALDGLDIDWEYPTNDEQAQNYVELLRLLRLELDSEAIRSGLPRGQFDLSIAAPAGPEQTKILRISEMDQYLSFWNLMTYDFSGSWSQTAYFHSNLYSSEISGNRAVETYINQGVAPNKIILGMPVYGRGFANTNGVGAPFSGVPQGTWENGVLDYKVLPLPNTTEHVDKDAISAYCYDPKSKTLIVYDNPETSRLKAQYVISKGLGGGMWWESSADFPIDQPRSLIANFTNTLGVQNIEKTYTNNLNLPEEYRRNLGISSIESPAGK